MRIAKKQDRTIDRKLKVSLGRVWKEGTFEFLEKISSIPMALSEIEENLKNVTGQSYSALHTVLG